MTRLSCSWASILFILLSWGPYSTLALPSPHVPVPPKSAELSH